MNGEPTNEVGDADRNHEELSRVLCDGLAPTILPASQRAGLRDRLLQRVHESVRRHAGFLVVRVSDGVWRKVKSGVRVKTLWQGKNGASVLIELARGASLPAHRHHHLEEGIVLQGSLQLDNLILGPGDYHVSPPGSRHRSITSPTGGLAYLRGTSLGNSQEVIRELLGGLVPREGPAITSVLARECNWHPIAEGADEAILWQQGQTVSRFIRLAPAGRLPAHSHASDEECMMLNGDAFFGDLLVQAGEYHLAPAGSEQQEISSDCGALLFVRGQRPLSRSSQE